jgi:hypothetical protein
MDEKDKPLSPDANQESAAAEQEENLEYLALEAQRHTPGSKEQNDGITRLIANLEKPGQLTKPRNTYDLPSSLYHDVYEDAKQKLHLELVEQIQAKKYDREKGLVINWARFHQSKKFKKAQKDLLNLHSVQEKGKKIKIQVLSADNLVIDSQSSDRDGSSMPHLERIPQTPHEKVNPLMSQELLELIKEDPETLFRSKCVKNHPEANFREIFLLQHSGYKWDEIALHFGLKMKAISAFYYRCCQDFAPLFKEYLQQ